MPDWWLCPSLPLSCYLPLTCCRATVTALQLLYIQLCCCHVAFPLSCCFAFVMLYSLTCHPALLFSFCPTRVMIPSYPCHNLGANTVLCRAIEVSSYALCGWPIMCRSLSVIFAYSVHLYSINLQQT